MTRHCDRDDEALFRAARRSLADIAAVVGPNTARHEMPKRAGAMTDRRGLAIMFAELDAQRKILCERRDQLGREIQMAARRMSALAAYAKCGGNTGGARASRGKTDGADR